MFLNLVCFVKWTTAQVPLRLRERYQSIVEFAGHEEYHQVITECKQLISDEPQFAKAYERLIEASKKEGTLLNTIILACQFFYERTN